ncbi:MAG: alpha-glucosidase [Planctomyces sp.]|nr:alpha-glucosidase [Planctomyces sp.]MBA4119106.1 alpha-glucosidase [Isosphaera sp.]
MENTMAQAQRRSAWWLLRAWALSVLFPVAGAMADLEPGRGEMLAGVSAPVARFVAPYYTQRDAEATFALQRVFLAQPGVVPAGRVTPRFQRLPDGRHEVRIGIEPGTSLYGTGEQAGPLLRNGRTARTWNTDSYGYNDDPSKFPSLYKSHPWVLAVRPDGTCFGVLCDTTWRTEIDLEDGIRFASEGPPAPVYVIERDTPEQTLMALGELSGTMPLPPLWAIGYHQCRYSYFPEDRVRQIADGFRQRKIPADVIWFDIDYMDGYRVFTFDKGHFPDPKGLNDELTAKGFHAIWMINPGIKAEKGFALHDELMSRGYEVKTASGGAYKGAVWPGLCVFPDYTSDEVRRWWAGLFGPYMANGINGVWNDMNEPAIFDVATKTMTEDNAHRGGAYAAYPGQEPQVVTPGPHARFHNVYGLLMTQGTYEGIKAANPQRRPFVLTRAGFMGSQRYAASWTGDNSATWTDMEQSVPMVLNLGLSGWAFSGPDIGGFIGNGPRDDAARGEFFARWLGFGALLPFSRGHTAKGNIDKEPWSFGPEIELSARVALERRYILLPYLYSLFDEAARTGLPVARPTFFADPKDPALRSEDDTFLLGSGLLVAPQLMPDRSRVALMPGGVWRKFDVHPSADERSPGLYIRGGAIIPTGPIIEWTGQRPLDPLTLYVCLDERGAATGTLYEDAGDGFGYQQGDFLRTTYTATRRGDTVTVAIGSAEGNRQRIDRPLIVRVVTESGVVEGVGRDGQPVTVRLR